MVVGDRGWWWVGEGVLFFFVPSDLVLFFLVLLCLVLFGFVSVVLFLDIVVTFCGFILSPLSMRATDYCLTATSRSIE